MNLVRCHHIDSSPDRDPASANSLLITGPYPSLNPFPVARLRGFLDALRAKGIYINLNLHVKYQFRPEVDRVPDVEGMPFPRQPVNSGLVCRPRRSGACRTRAKSICRPTARRLRRGTKW